MSAATSEPAAQQLNQALDLAMSRLNRAGQSLLAEFGQAGEFVTIAKTSLLSGCALGDLEDPPGEVWISTTFGMPTMRIAAMDGELIFAARELDRLRPLHEMQSFVVIYGHSEVSVVQN